MKNGTLKPDILAERTASSLFKCVAFLDVGVNEHCLFRLEDFDNLTWIKLINIQCKIKLYQNNKY